MSASRQWVNIFRASARGLLELFISPVSPGGFSLFDHFSRWATLVVLGVAMLVIIVAPVLAFSWIALPFPGFMVEQTLVVNSIGGTDPERTGISWEGRNAGLDFPQRVTHISGLEVKTVSEYKSVLASYEFGDQIEVRTITPEGVSQTYPVIRLGQFPRGDFVRLFWLPYIISVVYLISGVLVYRLRGNTRPGRAFSFAVACGVIVIGLIFDLSTTHVFSVLWSIAMPLIGSALISLALLFPEELQPVHRRAWMRLLAYVISIMVALWGTWVVNDLSRPWDYVLPWRYSYFYAALGFVAFFVLMVLRLQSASNDIALQQARIILWGSLISFTPLAAWFAIQVIFVTRFNPVLLLPFLLLFPIVLATCILRYRLWDIDVIVNRTLVYFTLTVVLALIYFGSVVALEALFRPFMGSNLTATVISTLLIASLFAPLRNRIQGAIDRRFYRRKYDMQKALQAFAESIRNEVELSQLSNRLLTVVEDTVQPTQVSLWLRSLKEEDYYHNEPKDQISI